MDCLPSSHLHHPCLFLLPKTKRTEATASKVVATVLNELNELLFTRSGPKELYMSVGSSLGHCTNIKNSYFMLLCVRQKTSVHGGENPTLYTSCCCVHGKRRMCMENKMQSLAPSLLQTKVLAVGCNRVFGPVVAVLTQWSSPPRVITIWWQHSMGTVITHRQKQARTRQAVVNPNWNHLKCITLADSILCINTAIVHRRAQALAQGGAVQPKLL
eukprot:266062-Pelagomonas_calceolata.AAC.3